MRTASIQWHSFREEGRGQRQLLAPQMFLLKSRSLRQPPPSLYRAAGFEKV